ncbi:MULTISPECIES: cbb3-type cytochrome oxidase assembly protein CcoS [Sphingomonadaceae]|jgi:cbb3-type cytochrome oxidase maturation protein|uniref:Coproporphyrinogen III oxidase n=1 Tax=Novosphingobium resinovorum TaxID=158500 RepID=A0A031JZM0_9SPHN|nr:MULTISPECIES: cbb3-type cytochrome oxidase assembly protein CcoS [Sphingomonadaceae]AOR77547.1 cytochrome oxidase maturation protein, cbb3-type [Novosphingobium resinovorum]EJU10170.1 hypothetical protein LH128_25258 [Sphingomonas sp. LH128]EZP82233.1 Coproporphyrinogen III oxidase [Novosphingobium resinovorum]MBF7012974.1 cbb3-type cytochrome oxidase assembly protein CcoS [Novosphingobium sp. HR1a]MEE4452403.1 cbb3-type cytochrome oxidase assembly protein CcoS [Novosphingobium resinovorum]
MTILGFMIPLSLAMGLCALGTFFWTMRSGQYEDMDGAANRILIDEDAP